LQQTAQVQTRGLGWSWLFERARGALSGYKQQWLGLQVGWQGTAAALQMLLLLFNKLCAVASGFTHLVIPESSLAALSYSTSAILAFSAAVLLSGA
jgi:hypothetical protein